ncbi:universal stress protein [Kitasatospora sp. NPDC051914]|uniref:universal stress protein n=1 Tax=Kitasatospora sp. NPDC051914 TaxID=3154945 RepID=UPI00343F0E65
MTRPVIAGIDTSPGSLTAAHWAAEEAAGRGTELLLVHAGPPTGRGSRGEPTDLQAAARQLLRDAEAAIAAAHPDLPIRGELLDGRPAEALLDAAGDAELLVLGTRGLGGFRGLLVGSVSLAVAGRTDSPVVLVPQGAGRPDGERREGAEAAEIVVGLDPQTPADAVLAFAFREAGLRGARLRVVHGWDLPPTYGYAGWVPPESELRELGTLETALVREAVLPWREKHPEVEVAETVRPGGPAGVLVEASAGAALVVVGRRTRAHGLGARLGSVAHAVLHHASAPVAVVPHA